MYLTPCQAYSAYQCHGEPYSVRTCTLTNVCRHVRTGEWVASWPEGESMPDVLPGLKDQCEETR